MSRTSDVDPGIDVDRHVANTVVRVVLEHAEACGGVGTIGRILDKAGECRPLDVLLDDSVWSSYGQFRRLLEATVDVLGGVEPLTHVDQTAQMVAGSTPSATETLQRLGSPAALLAELTNDRYPSFTFIVSGAHETGPTEWVVERRMKDGFEPFPAFCALHVGLCRIVPMIFGYTGTDAVEETCVCRGDDACRIRVRWYEGDEANRELRLARERISVLERRLEQFQDTVADLVLAEDLETALEQVVASVARSVRAPGFLLVIHPLPGLRRWVFAHGVDAAEAERVGALLLAGETCDELGEQVVDIESGHRLYGRLAVWTPGHKVFDDVRVLSSYARLAATALASASAKEDTRQEAARGRALLELAGALADITTVEAMAAILVQAATTVLGADRAVVTMADRERGVARVLASHGHQVEDAARLVGAERPITGVGPDRILYLDDDNGLAQLLGLRERATRRVIVPIHVDGEVAAWLTASVVGDSERLARNDDLEARLIGLAAQASSALRNARLVEQIRYQALHDSLTGLSNRALILDRAEKLLARARRDNTPVSFLFIDLDGFKEINDALGHAAGDELLRAAALRLSTVVRESDTLARLGGDEFVVLVDGGNGGTGPERVAERLLEALREPFVLDDCVGAPVTVTASIGIATAGPGATAVDLLRDADVALYKAKHAGKDRSMVFAPPGVTTLGTLAAASPTQIRR